MVYCQRCLVVTWLVPRKTAAVSAQVLCTPYNHAPVNAVTLLKVGREHVCLAVITCHLHFGQNERGSFMCYCSNMEVERIPKQVSAQKVDP